MKYDDALEWLYGLSARGVRLELDRMRGGLKYRGHPERELAVVHVAGSNGKGSVTAMTERILRAAGYRTGMFTSPHLHTYTERFRIDGRPLSKSEVARRLSDQHAHADAMPPLTFFEHSALLAFEAFRDHECEVCVIEVGLGGRLDATNVFEDPWVSVVTRITLEHKRILGDTLAKIAKEKGSIFRAGSPAVIAVRDREPQRVLRRMARRSDPWVLGEELDGELLSPRRARLRLGDDSLEVRLGLAGAHQVDNAATAAAVARRLAEQGWSIDDADIAKGIGAARWPGRMETIGRDPEILVDCAHNPDGCLALANHLRGLPEKKTVLLFGALADKPLRPMLAAFDGLVDRRVYAVPKMRRAPKSPKTYARIREGTCARSVPDAIARARRAAGRDGRIVVAGSIFMVHEVRAHLLGRKVDPPIGM